MESAESIWDILIFAFDQRSSVGMPTFDRLCWFVLAYADVLSCLTLLVLHTHFLVCCNFSHPHFVNFCNLPCCFAAVLSVSMMAMQLIAHFCLHLLTCFWYFCCVSIHLYCSDCPKLLSVSENEWETCSNFWHHTIKWLVVYLTVTVGTAYTQCILAEAWKVLWSGKSICD